MPIMNNSTNLVWHLSTVSRARREKLNAHPSVLLWFTGLSGSGKSTLAHAVEEQLHQMGRRTFVLDGDNVRHGLCSDLGFSDQDRVENIRRVGEVAKLFIEAGLITITSFIPPFIYERERARSIFPHGDFLEIYCRCPLHVCEERDVKGLYQRARTNEIQNFTGISSPYEEPLSPELIVDTDRLSLLESIDAVLALLRARGMIPAELEI
jgi:adenylylsulfate kinase